EGRFEWNSAPQEPLLYSVLAEGFGRAYAQTLQADSTVQEIKLSKNAPQKDLVQISGTVTDAETGDSLNAFKVYLIDPDRGWAFPLDFYNAGKNGQFTISFPTKTSHPSYIVQVEQDGYLPAVSEEHLRSDGNQKMEFKLRKGHGPAGVVFLPSGEPAANA